MYLIVHNGNISIDNIHTVSEAFLECEKIELMSKAQLSLHLLLMLMLLASVNHKCTSEYYHKSQSPLLYANIGKINTCNCVTD